MAIDTIARGMADSNTSQLNDIMKYIVAPSGFSWNNNPLSGKIWIDNIGKYQTGYDVAINKIAGKTYYINQITGNDSNDGLTPSTALKTLLVAYNKSDVKEIVICSKSVYYDNGMNGTSIDKSVTIRGLYGSKPIISNHINTTWTKTAGLTNVYQCTKTSPAMVLDISRKTTDGDYLPFTLVNSTAECDATEDTFYINGTTVYAHVKGNASPTTSIYVIRNDVNALTITFTTTDKKVYLENVVVLGGCYVSGVAGEFYGKNNIYSYGKYGSAFNAHTVLSINQNCIGSMAENDGFSYSEAANAVEINCIGRNNGSNNDDTNNGSTSHEGSKVIRLNGIYYNNYGPNIADVQDSTESWNLGCIAYNSLTSTSTQKCDYQTQDGAAKMFLEGCTGYGSTYSIRTNNTAQLYVKKCTIETYSINGTSNISEY